MAKQYYLPGTDTGKSRWLNNFSHKLAGYAAKYGISAAEVADMVNAALWFSYWLDVQKRTSTFGQKITAFKNEVRDGIAEAGGSASVAPVLDLGTPPTAVDPGIFDRATAIVSRIKGFQSYTIADGEDLGIEGAEGGEEEETPPSA